jgi:hypothetical protein
MKLNVDARIPMREIYALAEKGLNAGTGFWQQD